MASKKSNNVVLGDSSVDKYSILYSVSLGQNSMSYRKRVNWFIVGKNICWLAGILYM